MNRRVFAVCLAAFGWIPIALEWNDHVRNGPFTAAEWTPVVWAQLLVLAAGAVGGFIGGLLIGSIKTKEFSLTTLLACFGPAIGMVICFMSQQAGHTWFAEQFPYKTYGYLSDLTMFSTGLIGYASMLPAIYWEKIRDFRRKQVGTTTA